MRFQTRVLLALIAVAVAPLTGLMLGVRREMDQRFAAQDDARTAALAGLTREALTDETESIGARLAALRDGMADDNRLRLALVARDGGDRPYLLDYAGRAMQVTGLSMLQIQDSAGRILSSGHFRNEFDRLEPDLPLLLAEAPSGTALVDARTAAGPLRVIARVDSLRVAGRRVMLVGGVAVGSDMLRRLAPDSDLSVALVAPTTETDRRPGDPPPNARTEPEGRVVAATLTFPFITRGDPVDTAPRALASARFVITRSTTGLAALERSVDRWFAAAILLGILVAVALAVWLAGQVSSPLRRLADLAGRVGLDRLDVAFATGRADEVGDLSRLLDAMTRRLRASALRLRDAEHRATVGDMARQVNHDVKNGLVPIRHVLRHLAEVEREDPAHLSAVFAERRPTLDASVEYLDALARTYARLSRPLIRESCDVNALVRAAAATAAADDRVTLRLELDPRRPVVTTDVLVLRRVLENLVSNAVDAAAAAGGLVTLTTAGESTGSIRIAVRDNGAGMTDEQLARAFDHFQTTKPHGTGLGLSIVRRLTSDLGAGLRVDTAPGHGTAVQIELASTTGDGVAAAGTH